MFIVKTLSFEVLLSESKLFLRDLLNNLTSVWGVKKERSETTFTPSSQFIFSFSSPSVFWQQYSKGDWFLFYFGLFFWGTLLGLLQVLKVSSFDKCKKDLSLKITRERRGRFWNWKIEWKTLGRNRSSG